MSRLFNEVRVGDVWANPRGRHYEIVRFVGSDRCLVIKHRDTACPDCGNDTFTEETSP